MRSIVRYFLLILFLVGCHEGKKLKKPKAIDKEDASAEPVAYITDLPTKVSGISDVDVKIMGNATTYKYAFFTDTRITCKDATYEEFVSITTRLKLSLGVDGYKVICLLGGDENGNEQKTPQRYQWEKITAGTSLTVAVTPISYEQADINDDGNINDLDLNLVKNNIGKAITPENINADVDNNDEINQLDLAAVVNRFGARECLKAENIHRADVIEDRIINILDLTYVAKYMDETKYKEALTTDEERKADVCEDGRVGMVDLNAVSMWFGTERCPINDDVKRADINGDKVINILDLVHVAQHIGKIVLINAEEKAVDVCKDGKITLADLQAVASHFGETIP